MPVQSPSFPCCNFSASPRAKGEEKRKKKKKKKETSSPKFYSFEVFCTINSFVKQAGILGRPMIPSILSVQVWGGGKFTGVAQRL